MRKETENPSDFNDFKRVSALAEHLDVSASEITENLDTVFSCGRKQFFVLTDTEADELQDHYLDDFIDECLEIPEKMKNYFDRDAWKRDARLNGRGHSLSSCDGEEHAVGGFFIYRIY